MVHLHSFLDSILLYLPVIDDNFIADYKQIIIYFKSEILDY